MTGPMTIAALALAAAVVTRVFGLDHAGVAFCFFKSLTGYACFTCGTTRALGHLAAFDLPRAFGVQPLVTAGTLTMLLWGALDAGLALVSKRTIFRLEGRWPRIVFFVGLAAAIVNWIYLLATGV
jgi:hypothetical protein